MVSIAAVWFLQDLLQVLVSGRFLVPDIFLLYVLFRMTRSSGDVPSIVWAAFAGGLLWDLRWTALPGLTASLYSFFSAVCMVVWNHIPGSGRNASLFLILAISSQVMTSLVRFLTWGSSREALAGVLVIQLLSSIPFLVIAALAVSSGAEDDDVKH